MQPIKILLTILLSPLAAIYWLITTIRNWCYDNGIFKSTSFDIPIISVGNLAVGGSGKTPMVEYLITELKDEYTIATLSRGYGRKTKGFHWVESTLSPTQTGDEPLQIKTKFKDISVAVCEDRVAGVKRILADKPETTLILLDDAFQHRAIKPQIQLLLSTYSKPFFKDWLMPSGRLRESRSGAKRADAIVFTNSGYKSFENFSNSYNKPVFYTLTGSEVLQEKINGKIEFYAGKLFGFSALANNSAFKEALSSSYNLVGFKGFRDHYSYSQKDIDDILKMAGEALVVCTEKDWVKIKHLKTVEQIKTLSIRTSPTDNELIDWLKAKINES